ncbi:MAG: nitronate monooxygenase family protein [Myxococcota bacterium]|jgi:NAD(P)H-dependent flavin oxidoreductase YrpB (nitropropane dioxygenase family)|nr:monooxygenase [Deltaproteobacteria bacterium]MCP4242131.1 nitronate monooxygenase [bacterium]MDP6075206.1 nitronate monooxygenase family protein [Myxococcota bacterium]MDP7075027.1 nitronate monooxygenase family protein [Myxococcota bacterium]MDP7298255.1 nitronate monooxygenase family protein [Myxococcota bacterium]
MRTEICNRLGIEFPIFAFTHCRDVVTAVSQAGGLGVLGVVGFSPEQIEQECRWIDDHIGDKPYGIDLVIPQKYEGMDAGKIDPKELEAKLDGMIPAEHRAFAAKLLSDAGVPEIPEGEAHLQELLGWTESTATPQLDVALSHDKVRVIANALGTPPAGIVKRVQESGRLMGALCGKIHQAVRHRDAGLDFIIAQGYEGGGHTGEIGSVVLWPQIIDAVAPMPVLAAGGIGNGRQVAAALAMGAEGAWLGSAWLTTAESGCEPPQVESYLQATSQDTVRSRSYTGKPCRMLRNEWTEAWERDGTPDPLGMPLQGMVTADAVQRVHRYGDKSQRVAFNPVGQVVGQMSEVKSCRDVIYELVEQYVEASGRLEKLNANV